jgi:DNA primase
MELALPMLAPGRSLRFCLMPPGRDPDELIREEGRGAMQAALDAALPLVEMLWRREVEAGPLDTPEARAGFDGRLREALSKIADQGVREHYRAEIRTRRGELFRPARRSGGQGGRTWQRGAGGPARREREPVGPAAGTRSSDLARAGAEAARLGARIREAAILLIACRNPDCIAPVEADLERMIVTTPEFAPVRDALLSAIAAEEDVVAALGALASGDAVEMLERVPQARAHPLARPGQAGDRVVAVLAEAILRHSTALAYEAELADARRELGETDDESWTHRVRRASAEIADLERDLLERTPAAGGDQPSRIQEMLDREVYRAKKR